VFPSLANNIFLTNSHDVMRQKKMYFPSIRSAAANNEIFTKAAPRGNRLAVLEKIAI
jgi:hypothetical protein